MISLLIDTCTVNLVIAICRNYTVLYKLVQKNDSNLSTNFTYLVNTALCEANINVDDIDKIFIANGPGSFTGIRIGVTFAKTFAWARNIDVISFSSLEFMASNDTGNYIVPLIDARRGYVFAGIYDSSLNPILKDCYIDIEDLISIVNKYNQVTFVSNDNCIEDCISPDYDVVKIIKKHKNDVSINPHKLVPNYLKKTEAEEKNENKSN